jgi:hypothetical protein
MGPASTLGPCATPAGAPCRRLCSLLPLPCPAPPAPPPGPTHTLLLPPKLPSTLHPQSPVTWSSCSWFPLPPPPPPRASSEVVEYTAPFDLVVAKADDPAAVARASRFEQAREIRGAWAAWRYGVGSVQGPPRSPAPPQNAAPPPPPPPTYTHRPLPRAVLLGVLLSCNLLCSAACLSSSAPVSVAVSAHTRAQRAWGGCASPWFPSAASCPPPLVEAGYVWAEPVELPLLPLAMGMEGDPMVARAHTGWPGCPCASSRCNSCTSGPRTRRPTRCGGVSRPAS